MATYTRILGIVIIAIMAALAITALTTAAMNSDFHLGVHGSHHDYDDHLGWHGHVFDHHHDSSEYECHHQEFSGGFSDDTQPYCTD